MFDSMNVEVGSATWLSDETAGRCRMYIVATAPALFLPSSHQSADQAGRQAGRQAEAAIYSCCRVALRPASGESEGTPGEHR
jgi:hypothetical protein